MSSKVTINKPLKGVAIGLMASIMLWLLGLGLIIAA